MADLLRFYCWSCYGQVPSSSGECPHCGQPIEAPPGTGYTDRLIWALHHPLPERRLIACRVLGERGDATAVEPLRRLITESLDPYTTAAALDALIRLDGRDNNRALLELLARDGPVPVRWAARRLLRPSAP